MGIIIGDTIQLNNGLTVQNSYGSIGGDTVSVNKRRHPIYESEGEGVGAEVETIKGYTETYQLSGRGVIWVNKEKRTNNSANIKYENINIDYNDSTFLSSNLYTLLYSKWKDNFTTVTDDI